MAPGLLHAQFDFKIADRTVQVHSFMTQGYMYGTANSFLTLRNGGSFAMTDGGVNVSTNITDNLHVAAQAYDRSIGSLGKGTLNLDFAYADYRFKSWFGVRAGKVKTVLGLYNDTQDVPALSTWALLPQSMYSIDLRGTTIAHTGGDIYGTVSLQKLGDLSYTAYAGERPADTTGGIAFGTAKAGIHFKSFAGPVGGADLRWTTPLKGLTAGASFYAEDITADGVCAAPAKCNNYAAAKQPLPDHFDTKKDTTDAYYVTYVLRGLHIDGEYRRNWRVYDNVSTGVSAPPGGASVDIRSWYISAAYRISKELELGSYYSRFYSNWAASPDALNNRIYDKDVTARIDLNKYWNVKIEGHFMNGYGASGTFRGFYLMLNPNGYQPKTIALIVRTGLTF
jgi:hypothetical protein